MENAHTPLPWRIRKLGSVGGIIEALSGRVSYQGDEGWRVVATYKPCMRADASLEEEDENAQANAELIVRAVNSYHDMLAALEALVSIAEALHEQGWQMTAKYESEDVYLHGMPQLYVEAPTTFAAARAAIAKAKGE